MHDPAPSSIGLRDVVAAWAVCLGIAAAVLIVPPIFAAAGPSAVAARTTSARTQLCAVGDRRIAIPHG